MDISKIKNTLQFAVPKELYDIAPGQVAYFVSKEGLNQFELNTLAELMRYFRRLHKDNDIKLSIIPTDNELLIGTFAGRNPEQMDIPYKVVVSTWDTAAGFASQYFDEDVQTIVDREPKVSITSHINISTDLPAIVEINPENRPFRASVFSPEDSSDNFGIELLQKRPTNEKEKRDLIAKNEQKIRKIIWECEYLGLDLDVKAIIDDIEAIKSLPTDGYQLSLKFEYKKASGLMDCNIYVGEDKELKLTAIQKAVYLTFLTLEDGLVIETATPSFTKRIQNIYGLLPDKEHKEIEETGVRGILHTQYIQPKTLRGYMSEVNAVISKLIPNGLIAIEFAIEGVKDGAFKVLRSTPEIRERIIKAYNL